MLHDILSFLKKKYSGIIRNHILPCTVFCRDPLVLASFDMDFVSDGPAFVKAFWSEAI